jgi:ABC-type transport system involved in cytochrome c biogenesis permease subunit
MNVMQIELISFWSALVGYSIATAVACWAFVFRKKPERTLLALILLSCTLHTIAIAARWERLGYLPVNNTFEMLSANIWGLMVAVLIGYWLLPRVRSFVIVTLPFVMMLMAWMLLIRPQDSTLPPTYDTVWLFIHIAFIKLFLGCAFIALGLGIIVLLRRAGIGTARFASLPPDTSLDKTAYRCMALALIFDTLGIVAGAIWAQDAWGRFWSWDSLEIWSLLTWLSIGLTLHMRASFRTGPAVNAGMVLATWCVAFFTFFGIPFVSTALHKGMI